MNAAVIQRAPVDRLMPGPCPVISTPRLVLRPHRLSDAAAIAESLGDYKVSRMLAQVPQPYLRQDALDWLVLQTAGLADGWTLAITTGDDVHIGVVGIERRGGNWHLGYWLNRMFWDHGYMSEAVGAVLERFFRRMPDVTVRSGAFADNLASLHVQKKLGFRICGVDEVYSAARSSMVPHIKTVLSSGELRRPADGA